MDGQDVDSVVEGKLGIQNRAYLCKLFKNLAAQFELKRTALDWSIFRARCSFTPELESRLLGVACTCMSLFLTAASYWDDI